MSADDLQRLQSIVDTLQTHAAEATARLRHLRRGLRQIHRGVDRWAERMQRTLLAGSGHGPDDWPSNPQDFGRAVRQTREALGWTCEQLAAKAGVSERTVVSVEKTARRCRSAIRQWLIQALETALHADSWADAPVHFGQQVRQRREAAGLTRADLAKLADMPIATLRNIEHGLHGTHLEKRVRLIAALIRDE